jgi:hypothetical protein
MAAPRELLRSLGGFRTDLGRGAQPSTFEDVDLVDRVRERGGEVWYCPAARVRHRIDPAAARPREILLTSFNRGCNNRAGVDLGLFVAAATPVPRTRLGAGLYLPVLSLLLFAAAFGFRLTRSQRAFDAARRAAWGTGWCMWTVVGESSRRRAQVLRAAVLSARDVAMRLVRCAA